MSWGKLTCKHYKAKKAVVASISAFSVQATALPATLDSHLTGHSQAMGEPTHFVMQRTAQLNRSAPALPGRVDWPSAPGLFCYSCCQGHCPEAAPQSGPCSAAGHAAEPSPYFALSSLAGAPQSSCDFVFAFRQDDKQLHHMLGTQRMSTDVTHGHTNRTKQL